MLVTHTHLVPAIAQSVRFQEYGAGLFPSIPSRSALKKAIKKQAILIDGEIATTGQWIYEGQKIELLAMEPVIKKVFKLVFDLIYEDEDLAVINKPAGYPTSGNYFRTIQNAIPYNIKNSTKEDALITARPVHRLDNPTCGILIVAKTTSAQIDLHRQFENKTIAKTYHALVVGSTARSGTIDDAIENQQAITYFSTLKTVASLRNNTVSLVKLSPKTGRTHQLRIHLSQKGHPIVGDTLYGEKGNILKHKGLFLAATGISFIHPISKKKLDLEIPLPNKFEALLDKEERRYLKFNS